jgi:dihydrolipoamide dehydrogenase
VDEIRCGDANAIVRIEEEELECDMVLEATGRSPVTRGLRLEDIGIEFDREYVKVNSRMETSRRGFFAIGDMTGGPQLAHVASKGGLVAAENISGVDKELDLTAVPSCVFTIPPMASVGNCPDEEDGDGLEHIRIPFGSNSAAYSRGKEDGFLKLILEKKDGTVRGARVAGADANMLIAELTLAVGNRMKAHELAETIRAHPTLAEIVSEACQAFYGRSIHFYRPQKATSGKG